MKLLENSRLEVLNNALSVTEAGEVRITTSIESYSCKMVGPDKHLYKRMINEGGSPRDLQALSPPADLLLSSSHPPSTTTTNNNNHLRHHHTSGDSTGSASEDASGVLCDAISKRTLCYLKATLNASFSPDYDFSDAKSEEFSRERSPASVRSSVDTTLNATMACEYRFFFLVDYFSD
jgi:hypothetical protein